MQVYPRSCRERRPLQVNPHGVPILLLGSHAHLHKCWYAGYRSRRGARTVRAASVGSMRTATGGLQSRTRRGAAALYKARTHRENGSDQGTEGAFDPNTLGQWTG